MAEIKLNQELIEELQKCKTKEEVAKFAQENQLTDEELEKVVGGTFGGTPMYVDPNGKTHYL